MLYLSQKNEENIKKLTFPIDMCMAMFIWGDRAPQTFGVKRKKNVRACDHALAMAG